VYMYIYLRSLSRCFSQIMSLGPGKSQISQSDLFVNYFSQGREYVKIIWGRGFVNNNLTL
jgi:hypothetical protein